MGSVHPFKVLLRSEHENPLFVMRHICFQSFKALNTVVECGIARVKLKRLIWLDHRREPATIVEVIVYIQDVVGGYLSELVQEILGWLWLELRSFLEL